MKQTTNSSPDLKIGIALGAGAARGWAHIGILRALEELGIYPSVIAGASAGSLVGAAYASGNLDAMEEWVLSLGAWQVLGLMDFSVRSGGLVSGDKVFTEAERHIGACNIEDLKLPFAAVATELYTGRERWLQQGDLKTAVSASCAMPGLLAPVELDRRWLIDGALVNPVPVSLCRAMGADLVIAVNLASARRRDGVSLGHEEEQEIVETTATADTANAEFLPQVTDNADEQQAKENRFWSLMGTGREFLAGMRKRFGSGANAHSSTPSMLGVMSTSLNIMQARITRARMAGDPPDVILSPRLGEFGIMDFHRAKDTIAEGRAVVQRMKTLLEQEILYPSGLAPSPSRAVSTPSADEEV